LKADMKINFSEEWHRKWDHLEETCGAEAGLPPFLDQNQLVGANILDATAQLKLAFGKLVKLMRMNLKYSIQDLASKASVDETELKNIEEDPAFIPQLRTVYQLATNFKLPAKKLTLLAGLTQERDPQFTQEALRFAANSKCVSTLTSEEKEALNHFVSVILQRK